MVAPGGSPGLRRPKQITSPPGQRSPTNPATHIRAGDTTIARNRRPGLERESVEHDNPTTTRRTPTDASQESAAGGRTTVSCKMVASAKGVR